MVKTIWTWIYTIGVVLIFFLNVDGAPTQKEKQFGPCVGMDCLHGILMHGDEKQGDSHAGEDTFKRLEEEDAYKNKLQTGEVKIGLGDDENIMHKLMHDDKDEVNHMEQFDKPENPNKEKVGPDDAMETFHGVLMHGDDELGVDHEKEHAKTREEAEMTHDQAVDPEQKMHGEEGHAVHLEREQEEEEDLGDVNMNVDPEGQLHGEDGGHVHDGKPVEGPGEHDGKISKTQDPEHLLHGAGGEDVHSEENRQADDDSEGERGGFDGVMDPDAVLHGVKDMEEYQEWKKTHNHDKKAQGDGGSFLGFSFKDISASILNEVEEFKKRYLPKYWGGEDDGEKQPSGRSPKSQNGRHLEREDVPLSEREFDDLDMRHELGDIGDTAALSEEKLYLAEEHRKKQESHKHKKNRRHDL